MLSELLPKADSTWALMSTRPSHLERKFVTLYDSSNLYGGERLWRMQV
jgi:hypothetical protein